MVAAVNSAATPIASRYEAARSSRVRAPLLIHYHIFKNAGTSFKESVTQAPIEKALSYYDSFNARGFVPAARFANLPTIVKRKPSLLTLMSREEQPLS